MNKLSFLFLSAMAAILVSCISVAPVAERTVSMVVDLPGTTMQHNYLKSLEWFSYTFNSGKDVIDLKDEISGKIIGKGLIPFRDVMGGIMHIRTIITIESKDDKTRITSIAQSFIGDKAGEYDIDKNIYLKNVLSTVESFHENYKKYMTENKSGDTDW